MEQTFTLFSDWALDTKSFEGRRYECQNVILVTPRHHGVCLTAQNLLGAHRVANPKTLFVYWMKRSPHGLSVILATVIIGSLVDAALRVSF